MSVAVKSALDSPSSPILGTSLSSVALYLVSVRLSFASEPLIPYSSVLFGIDIVRASLSASAVVVPVAFAFLFAIVRFHSAEEQLELPENFDLARSLPVALH